MLYDTELTKEEVRERGYLRARDQAYDAIFELWLRRSSEGLTQKEIAEFLGRDPAWVSKALAGPSNWTMRTLGEIAEALDGVILVSVAPVEELRPSNYCIYAAHADESQALKAVETKVTQQPAAGGMTVKVVSPPQALRSFASAVAG